MTVFRKIGTIFRWLFDSEKSIDDFRKKSQWREDQLINELGQNPPNKPIALTAHVFYEEFATEVITALKSMQNISKVYISTPSAEVKAKLDEYLASSGHEHDVRVTPNRGRNFGPLFVEFSKELLKEESFIHVHSKKSLHSPDFATDWLTRNTDLLLSESGVQRIRGLVSSYPKIGLVFADISDLLYGTNFRWGRSLKIAKETFADRNGFEHIKWSGRLSFPAGGMFWIRTQAIKPLLEIDWNYEMFPLEKGQGDGTMQHALERMIGQLPLSSGFKQAAYLKLISRFKLVSEHKPSKTK
jgi:lipopolysaccharide biosynthesis protein